MNRTRFALIAWLTAGPWLLTEARADEPPVKLPPALDRPIDFARDVRPLFEQHCCSCHGSQSQESGLRLDRRAALIAGGDLGKVVIPGDSAASRLIHYVAGTNPDQRMPPDEEPLPDEAIGTLRAWIDQGCVWPESEELPEEKNTHWAYEPLRVPALPAVTMADWPVNPIDRFVLAELEKHGVSPSPEADRYTLIRRLYLDLLGLLPPLDEVDAFVQDAREDAYERLVDRLLQSPHFGERWGRHWLDMARYADSDGYEKDNPRPDAYRYRDWVIDSINGDLPFDQFTIEQLAGDLLPDATPMQRLATAFHRQTLTNTEGGVDQEEFRVEACFDRTETTGAVWLGLTVGCARCHSHKYDAISQREYYQLFAFFNNGDEQTTVVPKSAEEVAAYQQAKAVHDERIAELAAQLHAEQARLADKFATREAATRKLIDASAASPLLRHLLDQVSFQSDGDVAFQPQPDGSVLVSGMNPERAVYTVVGQVGAAEFNALRLDVLPDPSLPAKGPGRVAHGNFVLNQVTLDVSPNADFAEARRIEFASAKADFEQGGAWLAAGTIDGRDDTGWAISPEFGKPHWLVLRFREPLAATETLHVRVQLSQQYGRQHTLGRFKLSLQSGIEPEVTVPDTIVKLLAIPPDKRTQPQCQQLLDHFSTFEPATSKLLNELNELRRKEPPKPELTVRVIGQRASNPRTTFVLKRGGFLEPLLDQEVTPGALAVLPSLEPRHEVGAADRLDLARWLVSPDHPLTPRVAVNHAWRLLFGQGLVRTPGDFGVRGEPPTHPELLDWLAADFLGRTSGDGGASPGKAWSRKSLIKRIAMSATYRQSSHHRPELGDIDPLNIWLARQNRVRVEGEIVRDISLDAAGLLSRKIGGPSVYPPLPPGVAELSYAGNFKWTESGGEDRYRRGMYTFFKRTAPHPNLIVFDCPDANLTNVSRQTSNTPLQSLTTLNNAVFVEAARALARQTLAETADGDRALLALAFRRCLARPATEAELNELSNLLAESRQWFVDHPDQARALIGPDAAPGVVPDRNAAWTAVARILLNLDEFLTRE
ncbi:MAG: DUF1549 domain-containing protein [Pirellulaceae bacterium]|nr:DUF1549 domain-containing protein [Pirellulaceae bacterium]